MLDVFMKAVLSVVRPRCGRRNMKLFKNGVEENLLVLVYFYDFLLIAKSETDSSLARKRDDSCIL